MASSQSILNWFYEKEFDRASIDFDDHLADAVEHCLDKARINAEIYAENTSDKLWDDLRKQITDDKNRGLYPTFSEVAPGMKRLFWYPNYFPPGVSKSDRQRRLRIRSRVRILNAIEVMNSTQYEALSVMACKLSGARRFCMTPGRNEFGIDFFAVIPSLGKSHLLNGGGGPIRIVGQCKKHSNRVPRANLQQFISTLNSVHQRSEDVRDLIPGWFLRERGPIVGWFVTHKGLQSGAKDYANSFGIVHSDSRDIAEILTMSRTWQPTDGLLAPLDLMRREIDSLLT